MSRPPGPTTFALPASLLCAALGADPAPASDDGGGAPARLERITTIAPFPRGLAMVGDRLYVLCRGRVRGAGGVTAAIDDQAGTIYAVDPAVTEPAGPGPVGHDVRTNGTVVARPTDPPFRLWDRAADPPELDRRADRPYCTLRWHEPTRSFYVCAFSGIDRPRTPEDREAFSKNGTDALLRYDLRTGRWHEVERHDASAGWRYPHHDPARNDPPHGLLKGPDNCLPLGDWLYAVAKDNSVLARYDLRGVAGDPWAGPPPSEVVLGERVVVRGLGERRFRGQSGLAFRDGWLYVAYRTSSAIIRLPLDEAFEPVRPIEAELVARFDPWDPATGKSANLTDLAFDDRGRLYVVSAQPARIYRLVPDPDRVFDAREGREPPWLDLAALTGNPRMKSENLLVHEDRLYVTSGDGYGYQAGADGTVYRVALGDAGGGGVAASSPPRRRSSP